MLHFQSTASSPVRCSTEIQIGGKQLKRRLLLLSGVTICLAGATGETFAADETAASQTATNPTVGEVVVTARRREENLQKVPEAVSAFSQQSLTAKSIYRPWDLGNQVPGLSVLAESGRGNAPSFEIRGIGPEYGAAAGSVETYFAEVPLSGPFQEPAMSAPFFDLQSLQVLKGPQGTLFGRSTTGGAVLIVPQAPTNEFGGYGRVQFGNYNAVQVEGAINLPIVSDKVLARVAGFRWDRQGYGKTVAGQHDFAGRLLPVQTYDNQNVVELRGTLLLKPTDSFENSTIVTYHRDDDRNTGHASVIDPNTALGGPLAALYPGITNLPVHLADISTNLSKIPSKNWGVFNTTTYKVTPNVTVKNLFGFIHAQGVGNVSSDVDGAPLPAIDLPPVARIDQQNQTTDELQLQGSDFSDRLTWIAGGLLDKTAQPGGAQEGPLINVMNALPGVNTYFQQNTFNNYGAYVSATYKITEPLSVTAGYRHSWDDIHVVQDNASTTTAQYLANPGMIIGDYPPGVVTHLDHRVRFQGDSYNAGLQYQLSSETMVYGGYRHGFKQGGFNVSSPPNEPAEQVFKPESVDDFSIGLKTNFDLANVTGRFDIEGFWDLYHDKQASYLTLTGAGANASLSTVTVNVPETTYRGFDLDFVADLTHWLQLSATYTYIDAEYNKWTDTTFGATAGAPGCPIGGCVNLNLDLSKNPVAFVSPNKFSITLRFHAKMPDNIGELVFQPNVTYQDKLYTIGDAFILPQGETAWLGLPYNYNSAAHGGDVVSSYALLNLRLELIGILGSRVDAALNVTNVANKDYSVGDTTSIAFGVQSDSYGPPRMITFELSTKF